MPPRTAAGRALRKAAILAFSLLASAAVLEGVIRVFDPLGLSHFRDMGRYLPELCELRPGDRIFAQRPGRDVAFRGFSIKTNSLGFRGPELEVRKPPGTKRILFLGDSVVLGWGAREEDLFVRRAEEELRAAHPGQRIECVNTGHNQYDTTQEAALFDEALAAGVDPDAVLLVFVYNDITLTRDEKRRLEEAATRAAPARSGPLSAAWTWLRTVPFQGLNALWTYLSFTSSGAEQNDRDAAIAAALAGDAPGWRACRDALRHIASTCAERRIPFIVLDTTEPGQLPQVEEWCKESGIEWRPFRFTEEEAQLPIRRSASDPHANRLGHDLLLRKLRPILQGI
jgi:lysophospholipase L1-like esterase